MAGTPWRKSLPSFSVSMLTSSACVDLLKPATRAFLVRLETSSPMRMRSLSTFCHSPSKARERRSRSSRWRRQGLGISAPVAEVLLDFPLLVGVVDDEEVCALRSIRQRPPPSTDRLSTKANRFCGVYRTVRSRRYSHRHCERLEVATRLVDRLTGKAKDRESRACRPVEDPGPYLNKAVRETGARARPKPGPPRPLTYGHVCAQARACARAWRRVVGARSRVKIKGTAATQQIRAA